MSETPDDPPAVLDYAPEPARPGVPLVRRVLARVLFYVALASGALAVLWPNPAVTGDFLVVAVALAVFAVLVRYGNARLT